MTLGRVVGSVWSSHKDSRLDGQRLLLVQPVTPELQPTGRTIVAVDATRSAGAGELVYLCRGKESSFPFLPAEVPTDISIVGIVDELHVDRTVRNEEA
jgi:ethanolamine utilization protein EutN